MGGLADLIKMEFGKRNSKLNSFIIFLKARSRKDQWGSKVLEGKIQRI